MHQRRVTSCRPGAIWTAPYFSQEIVTGNKLGLSKAPTLKEVEAGVEDVRAGLLPEE